MACTTEGLTFERFLPRITNDTVVESPQIFVDYVLLFSPSAAASTLVFLYLLTRPALPVVGRCVFRVRRWSSVAVALAGYAIVGALSYHATEVLHTCDPGLLRTQLLYDAARFGTVAIAVVFAAIYLASALCRRTCMPVVTLLTLVMTVGIGFEDYFLRRRCDECASPLFLLQMYAASTTAATLLVWDRRLRPPQPRRALRFGKAPSLPGKKSPASSSSLAKKSILRTVRTPPALIDGLDNTRVARYSP